ncbi:alkene reductase [Acidovorax sp. SUPP2522]|uniref:oxidoreductase n=1 Tax=unclassified Acidovorax TaxID=2684926 RepID=UPI00234B3194|nr:MULTISPECIES: alkene reductase [unclassified Acidovorax]WCM97155.1 alkene reductase [Acidovorax sp. GBBC 1281]GKT17219.1 alkene reductase [Acidovorax sp. SUPP2522]
MSLQLLSPFVHHDIFGPMRNRVAMAAMTRGFADAQHRCTDEIAAYYARRAAAGVSLILTEGIVVHPSADGYRNVPHLQNDEQADSWIPAVRQVQEAGGRIVAQLWHCGRISHPDFTGGLAPVSSTDRPAAGINRQNGQPYGQPRALHASEMPGIYRLFEEAAQRALNTGFDGVQIHMGHGYLIDQFLDARINDRTDAYGGSVENRCRIVLELVERLLPICGPQRLMIRLSPARMMGGLYEWPDLDDMLQHLIAQLDRLGLRQLDISCADAPYAETSGKIVRRVRPLWPHFLMGGASLSAAEAEHEIQEGHLDMVTWGRALLANPDFVRRLERGEALEPMTPERRAVLY